MMEGRCKTEVLDKVRGRKSTELAVTPPQGAAFTWHAEVLLQEVPPKESTLWTALELWSKVVPGIWSTRSRRERRIGCEVGFS